MRSVEIVHTLAHFRLFCAPTGWLQKDTRCVYIVNVCENEFCYCHLKTCITFKLILCTDKSKARRVHSISLGLFFFFFCACATRRRSIKRSMDPIFTQIQCFRCVSGALTRNNLLCSLVVASIFSFCIFCYFCWRNYNTNRKHKSIMYEYKYSFAMEKFVSVRWASGMYTLYVCVCCLKLHLDLCV